MIHYTDLLSAHLDGELSAVEAAEVAAHLGSCEACSRELALVAEARHAVRSLPVLEPPLPLVGNRRRHRGRWMAAAASLAAGMVAVGIVLGPGQRAPVFDLDTMAGQHTARVGVDPGIALVRTPLGAP